MKHLSEGFELPVFLIVQTHIKTHTVTNQHTLTQMWRAPTCPGAICCWYSSIRSTDRLRCRVCTAAIAAFPTIAAIWLWMQRRQMERATLVTVSGSHSISWYLTKRKTKDWIFPLQSPRMRPDIIGGTPAPPPLVSECASLDGAEEAWLDPESQCL